MRDYTKSLLLKLLSELLDEQIEKSDSVIFDCQIPKLREEMTMKLNEVLSTIESTGQAILDAVKTESEEILAAIESAKVSGSADDLDAVSDAVMSLKNKVTEAVTGLVPTMVSPVEPTTPETETPVEVVEPPAMPDVEVPIDVSPSPEDVGVEGGSNIDVAPPVSEGEITTI